VPGNAQSTIRVLQTAAYVVIVAWGIKEASHILSVVLISLLLTFVILPLPKWLTSRCRVRKSVAIVLTVAIIATLYVVVAVGLAEAGFHLREKLPIYAEQFHRLNERIAVFLSVHGIHSADHFLKNSYGTDQIADFAITLLPETIDLLSIRLLTWLLSLIFLIEIVDNDGGETSLLARNLVHYGKDVQRYIVISGQTGAMVALANLVLLIALGVDFPLVWCFLYFFLQFIPSIGFLIAIVPPAFMALLMLGWQRALLVVGGLILTQMISDYVIQPMLMKKMLHVSFLQVTLSLIIWGFLLGPAGAVLAVPLTMSLEKYIENPLAEGRPALAPR
jgi:predicted PurR-regulated permease PerM